MPINPSISIPINITFELRYNYGYEYLDRTGKVINEIILRPGWIVSNAQTAFTSLVNTDEQIIFNFGPQKLDLVQRLGERKKELSPIDAIARLCDDLSLIIIKRFNLQQFLRIGFRVHQLFKADTLTEAKEFIKNLKIFEPNLSGETVEEVSYTMVISEKEWKSRIAIAPAEQIVEIDPATIKAAQMEADKLHTSQKEVFKQKVKAQKIIDTFPQYAILVDIDSYVEDPPIGELKIMDFIRDTYNTSLSKARQYLGG
ncbi:MAG: hypothetical protein QME51_07320 [Planctomycetota bacterium]|nr:hypothetical protein [Planctomycetota bacterium]